LKNTQKNEKSFIGFPMPQTFLKDDSFHYHIKIMRLFSKKKQNFEKQNFFFPKSKYFFPNNKNKDSLKSFES